MSYSPWGHKELDTTERLSLSIHDYSVHLFIFCVCYLYVFHQCHCFQSRLFTSLTKYIPRYFILFDAIVNGIYLLIIPL